jgi:outer membrane receptor protein involved in Fe transport
MQMLIRTSLLASLIAGLLPVYAQETNTLDEITVSADLRNSQDKELAASTTVLTSQQLKDQGATNFGDVLLQTPNLNYSGQSSLPRHIQIRGMGERDEYTGAPNASVGFAIDDIDFSGIGMTGSLFDVKQVEVLRGPQSTRYGSSALAGLINIQSNEPTAESEQMIEASAGGDNLRELGLVSSGAFNSNSDSPQYRFSMFSHTSDGFRHNSFLNRDDTNGRNELNIRGKLRFFPSAVTTVDVTLLHSDLNDGYDAWSLNNNVTTLSDQPGKDTQLSNAGAVKVTHKGNPNYTLVSTTTLANSNMTYSYDEDWVYPAFDPVNGYSAFYQNDKHRRTLSQEFRLISTKASRLFNNSTDWLVGGFGSQLDEGNRTQETYAGVSTTDYNRQNLAVFGQLDYHLSKSTTLSAGLRTEQVNANFSGSNGDSFSPSETLWGGHLTLSEQLNEQHTAYASISRGYKASGFNPGLPATSDEKYLRYAAETALNYEIGIKSTLPQHNLRTKVSLFYTDRSNPQFDGYSYDPISHGNWVFFTENLATAHNYGVETEFNWQPHPRWKLFGNLGLLMTDVSGTPLNSDILVSNRQQAHAPNYQALLGTQYKTAQGYFMRIDVNAVDRFYFDNVNNIQSSAYTLLNARVGYQAKDWEAFLWGRNITDERYATRGFYFGNNPQTGYAEESYTRLGDRQQVGITTRFYF